MISSLRSRLKSQNSSKDGWTYPHFDFSLPPEVLRLPFLPHVKEKAKLSMLTTIDQYKDPLITECLTLLSDPYFLSRNYFPSDTMSARCSKIVHLRDLVHLERNLKFAGENLLHQNTQVTGTTVLIIYKSSLNLKTLWLLSLSHTPGITFSKWPACWATFIPSPGWNWLSPYSP